MIYSLVTVCTFLVIAVGGGLVVYGRLAALRGVQTAERAAWEQARCGLEAAVRDAQAQTLKLATTILTKEGKLDQQLLAITKELSSNFNETVTNLMIGYKTLGQEPNLPGVDFSDLPNNFDVPSDRQWIPAHEMLDSNMNNNMDGVTGIKPVPEGPGGWVNA